MGAGLVKVKRRINSVQSTYKVTKAMQLISAAKFIKKKKMMDATVNYAAYLGGILSSCTEGLDEETITNMSPLLSKTSGEKATSDLYIGVTSSLGLCGGYNLNLLKVINESVKKGDEIMIIGFKGQSKLKGGPNKVDEENVSVLERFDFTKAKKIRQQIETLYLSGKYKNIYLVYTHFKNALTFVPSVEKILPIEKMPEARAGKDTGKIVFAYPPDFYPNKERVLSLLIPKYLDTVFFERLTEAGCCEEGARRNAMENASDNAEDLKNSLTVTYNKARQAEITNQINEIMAGRLAESDE